MKKYIEKYEVLKAQKFINEINDASSSFNNSPEFISAVKYIGKKQNVKTEFFLDGVSCGDNIDPIFKDFNIASDMIYELGATEYDNN